VVINCSDKGRWTFVCVEVALEDLCHLYKVRLSNAEGLLFDSSPQFAGQFFVIIIDARLKPLQWHHHCNGFNGVTPHQWLQ
jgi:hypothetical protein